VGNVDQQQVPRGQLKLNLVATQAGSFILALDLSERQMPLFREDDPGMAAIERLIEHVNQIQESPDAYTGDRPGLIGLRKVASVIRPGVEAIEITIKDREIRTQAAINPTVKERIDLLLGAPQQGERTVRGHLIEIDIENNTCKVHPNEQRRIDCAYEEALEEDLIAAIGKEIEMAGQFVPLDRPAGHFRITKIERFRILGDDDDE
jgi:hypothetical protein